MPIADKFIKKFEAPLSKTIGYIRDGTSYLTPKDDWVENLRRRFSLSLDPFTRPFGRSLVAKKGRKDYFATVTVESDKVEVALMSRYQRNLTSTRKYRTVLGSREWADGSFVYDPEDTEWQHHVYLFERDDGKTDVYGHKETSAEHDPYGHVTDGQTHGDPDGIARGELERAGVNYA